MEDKELMKMFNPTLNERDSFNPKWLILVH